MDKGHLSAGDPYDIAWLEASITHNTVIADSRSVTAAEVPNGPLSLDLKNFRVVPARLIFFDDDLIRGGSADCDGSAGNKPENIRPFFPVPDDEIGECTVFRRFILRSHCLFFITDLFHTNAVIGSIKLIGTGLNKKAGNNRNFLLLLQALISLKLGFPIDYRKYFTDY